MILSAEKKRLLTASAAAVLFHCGLFVCLDVFLPSLDTPALVSLPSELLVSFLPPVSRIDEEAEAVQPPEESRETPLSSKKAIPEDSPEFPAEEAAEPSPVNIEADPPAAPAEEAAQPPEPVERGAPADNPQVMAPGAPTPPSQPQTLSREAAAVPVSFRSLALGRSLKAPAYPSRAKQFKMEGTVRVSLGVAPDGSITSVALVESSGFAVLDQEVLSTIRNFWEFNPPGQAITLNKNFTFRLQ